jgi:hypothetical protein
MKPAPEARKLIDMPEIIEMAKHHPIEEEEAS